MISHPEELFFLLILIPVFLILWRRYTTGKKSLRKIAGVWRADKLENVFTVKWFFSTLTFLIFCACLILAYAGISWGRIPQREEREGVDIVLLIDVSRSMLCRDVSSNRLNRSLEISRGIIESHKDSRIALCVFKGDAITLVPATEDRTILYDYLEVLSTGVITSPGSDLEKGVNHSVQALPGGEEVNQAIILFSDGEQLSGDGESAARQAGIAGIPVIALGIGTEQGGYIPLADGSFVKNDEGERVITVLTEKRLMRIAELSGGYYFSGENPSLLKEISGILRKMSSPKTEIDFRFTRKERYRFFMFLALAALSIHLIIRILRWKDTF